MQQKIKEENLFNKTNGKLKIGIVVSTYHCELTQNMERSCVDYLTQAGVKKENINVFYAPGSWEIPLIVQNLAQLKKYDGIVTFGVIVKGETYHFEIIANNCAKTLMEISLKFNIPVIVEVLAVYSLKQARERALGKSNKGIEGAKAVLKTMHSLKKIIKTI